MGTASFHIAVTVAVLVRDRVLYGRPGDNPVPVKSFYHAVKGYARNGKNHTKMLIPQSNMRHKTKNADFAGRALQAPENRPKRPASGFSEIAKIFLQRRGSGNVNVSNYMLANLGES